MPTCPRCDATTGEGDRFCLTCGRALVDGAEAMRADPHATDMVLPVVTPSRPAAGSSTELVACPSCDAYNAAGRRWCGRCGTALVADTPQQLPVGSWERDTGPGHEDEPAWDPADAPHGAGTRDAGRRRGAAIAVVALGAVIGTGLGVAAAAGVGPFARVEPVPFDPAAYPGDPAPQAPATAESSSTATPAEARQFAPKLTVDGDLTTAWVPQRRDEQARLRHGFVAPVWVDRLEVATGDQQDADTFAETARVTEVLVDLGTQRLDVTLADRDGVQVVQLPEPVLTDEVSWEVTDTTDGVGAIAEVRYVGWAADEEDRQSFRDRP